MYILEYRLFGNLVNMNFVGFLIVNCYIGYCFVNLGFDFVLIFFDLLYLLIDCIVL